MPDTNGHRSSGTTERTALYLRVSSEEQRNRETIEIQREFLEQYCLLYELEVAHIYEDDGISGTIPLHERPDGRRLLEDAKAGNFDAVLVFKLDRLGRRLHLRHLERYPLRTPYTAVADGVVTLVEKLRDLTLLREEPELLVDNTGVGRAVTDVLRDKGLRFKAITLTGGSQVMRGEAGEYRVPKADVVDALVVPFQAGTLKVARGLVLWATLRTELLNFRRKISPATAHASYEHWRESDHDDLVLAAALAA